MHKKTRPTLEPTLTKERLDGLGADPVVLIGTRNSRLEIGKKLGADYVFNVRSEKDIIK